MLMLIVYLLIALLFSFLCSIAEAVLLSVTRGHVLLLEKNGHRCAPTLAKLQADINKPLAAILSLNTIAHTIGAAGVGAQASLVFGSAYLGITSAVLTLLILVFSEIIPKSLGAHYWKALAPATAYALRVLVIVVYPLVKLSEMITGKLVEGPRLSGFSRREFAVMADLGSEEGQLDVQESRVIKNLLRMQKARVEDIMTPRTVVFSVPSDLSVGEFFEQHGDKLFSRIPIYYEDRENILGFVLRSDLLQAQASGRSDTPLREYKRPLIAVPALVPVARAFETSLQQRRHLMLVVDEYGGLEGIVTLEDMVETLLGSEIVDESDKADDMQHLARELAAGRNAGPDAD